MAFNEEPPRKRRKLSRHIPQTEPQDTERDEHCIWCKENKSRQDEENKNEDDDECVCKEIEQAMTSSKCHEIIEINNSGNCDTLFKTYKLLRNDEQSLFQINCKNDDIDFDGTEFQTKLRNSLNKNGIIILRNLFPIKDVLNARYDILTKYLSDYIEIDEDDKDITMKAKLKQNESSTFPSLLNKALQIIENTKTVKHILENDKLFKIISILLESEHIITTKYKWLRSVEPSKFTGLHMDKMYMGLGFKGMLSIWIPIGDISISDGSLIWSYGSHKCVKWKKYLESINYGDPNKLNKDGTTSGWITDKLGDYKFKHEHNGLFCTTDFKAGDVAIFGLDLIHQTLRNDSECYRISCDTRWQPICQELDHRLRNCGITTHNMP